MMRGIVAIVIPAKAGIQRLFHERHWVPAFAGTTGVLRSLRWIGTLQGGGR